MLVIYLSTGDFFFSHTRWLSNLIGVVLVVALTVAWFTRTPVVWEGLVRAAAVTPARQLVAIHVLRLLAIGTVVKYFQKQLPLHFVVFGSLPDFLVVWHVIGFSAFLGAGLSMFFTVPSALRLYQTKPDTSIMFRFPMVLAPNFTVPLFMIAHLFALVKLLAV